MIIFDEIKDKEILSVWWKKILDDVKSSYPLMNFSNIDNSYKMNICVDIGCNVGCFSYLASKNFKKVVAFEPAYYTSIIARTKINQKENINNVVIHNLAVGKNTGDILKLSCDVHNGSLNSGNASTVYDSSVDNYELVMSVSLDKVFELAETNFIDYLKIDCEGSEYDILLNQKLSNIGIITGEIHKHPYKDFETARKELIEYLQQEFNVTATKHNFFAVNKKFNINPNLAFYGG